jgi:hypothetical protein
MNHKPLRPTEISYLIQAKIEDGITLESELKYRYDVAKAAGEPEFVYEAKGQMFSCAVNVVDDLKDKHGIDAIAEMAAIIGGELERQHD